ncbi:MAG: hypothetical protein ACK5LY_10355, partial [Lachnospirales bacterium]
MNNRKSLYLIFIPIILIIIMGATLVYDMKKDHFVVYEDKINFLVNAGFEQYESMDINDIETIKNIKSKTGIEVNYVATTEENEEEFFNAITNKKFDVYYKNYKSNELKDYYSNNLILDIKPYLDDMPNFKKIIEKYPEVSLAFSENEMLYIPIVTVDGINTTKLAIRKDWLNEEDIKEVNSFSDLKVLLTKMKKSYDDNELRNQGEYFVGLSGIDSYIEDFYSSFNTYDGLYVKDNNIVFGGYENNFRELLISLNSFTKDGLIDTLQFTSDKIAFEKYILTNQTACFFDNSFDIERLSKYSYENGDNIDFV